MTDSPTRPCPTFEAAGVRGSRATTDVNCSHYGGDTTCLVLTSSTGEHLLVDGGSGLSRLNSFFASDEDISIFISHAHLDHIQGFLFFDAFSKADKKITIHCSATTQGALTHLFAPPYFPISLTKLPSTPRWNIFPNDAGCHLFHTPSFQCEAIPIPHPGGAYGLLVTDKTTGETILVLNDIEIHPNEPFEQQPGLKPLLQCVQSRASVDTLIVDAMFDPSDMATHKGWGHSDFKTAITFGTYLQARTIYLAHHNPTASDTLLTSRQQAISEPNVSILRQHHVHPWKV